MCLQGLELLRVFGKISRGKLDIFRNLQSDYKNLFWKCRTSCVCIVLYFIYLYSFRFLLKAFPVLWGDLYSQLNYINKDLNHCNSSSFHLSDFILATGIYLWVKFWKEKSSFHNILPLRFALSISYLPIILFCWAILLLKHFSNWLLPRDSQNA